MSQSNDTTNTVFDHDYLKNYTAEDEGLQREVLALFFEQIQSLLDRMDLEGDAEEFHGAAHAIKGSARGLGLVRLGDEAARLEAMKGASSEEMAAAKALLEEEIARAREAVAGCYPDLFAAA